MINDKYTQKEDKIIIKLRNKGTENHKIALKLGRSLDGVKGRVRYLIRRGALKSRHINPRRHPKGHKTRRWTEKEITKLKKLRKSEKSYFEIARKLNRTVDAIQQMSIRLMRTDDRIISRNTPKDTKIYDLNSELSKIGLLLWWAEGTKGGSSVQFVNSSPDMVRVYVRFLNEVGVDKKRLKAKIKVMNSSQVGPCQKYWSKITKIPIKNFTKPIVRGKKIDKDKKDHKGCVTITYCSINLKKQMGAKLLEIKNEILSF